MPMRLSLVSIILVFALPCSGLGCRRSISEEANKKHGEAARVAHDMQLKRENRKRQLHDMNVVQLAAELLSESERGVEPFNSMTFTEITSRGEAAGTELKASLTRPDRTSFLGLLALRKISSDQYKALAPGYRIGVLVDSLRTSKYFNAWGIPHAYWEDAAKALIEEGAAAQKPLSALLGDKRDAPVWGSEEVHEYQEYHYRVCDYAWALLNGIQQKKLDIPKTPEERDRLIAPLLNMKGTRS